ncbi:MAG: hypothetical protein LBS08_01550 [Candidatus Symbiothrix sp.]|jgi:hypothetical protein|nr:hypothetical protein [Candidatus Symbiothrix sp.]
MKHILIIFAVLFITNSLFAQFSVHLNYSEATKAGIGIGYDFNKRFWSTLILSRGIIGETETETVLERFDIYNISTDISVKYNLISQNYYDIYFGVGALFNIESNPAAFFTVPVGLRIRPFEKLNKIAFQIELQPAMRTDMDDYLFGKLGISYYF